MHKLDQIVIHSRYVLDNLKILGEKCITPIELEKKLKDEKELHTTQVVDQLRIHFNLKYRYKPIKVPMHNFYMEWSTILEGTKNPAIMEEAMERFSIELQAAGWRSKPMKFYPERFWRRPYVLIGRKQ